MTDQPQSVGRTVDLQVYSNKSLMALPPRPHDFLCPDCNQPVTVVMGKRGGVVGVLHQDGGSPECGPESAEVPRG